MSDPTNKQDDDALDDYLAGDSKLSRQYRDAGKAAPSAALDRAILDAARDAVSEAPAEPRRRLTLMWERPWAIAAVVALSAVLVVSIQREAGLFAPDQDAASPPQGFADVVAEPEVGQPAESPASPALRPADGIANRQALSDAPARLQSQKADAGRAVGGIAANAEMKRERTQRDDQDAASADEEARSEIVVTASRVSEEQPRMLELEGVDTIDPLEEDIETPDIVPEQDAE